MNDWDKQLRQMVEDACRHRSGSVQRQKNLTRIIRIVSNKLWKDYNPYYQDALQQTWIYFCQNICEGNTADPYNPDRGTVVTWLNSYLKRRLQDFYIEDQKQKAKTVSPHPSKLGDSDEVINPIENVAAEPEVPDLLEEVRRWVEDDPTGELSSVHISNCPQVTCQVLILRRLPPEQSWKELAKEFNVSISTLSSFYQRQCLPRLRKFGESEGYL